MTGRTVLRGDDISSPQTMQRPLNERLRGDALDAASAQRREQSWLRFDSFPLAGQNIRGPGYSIACLHVLRGRLVGTGTSPFNLAPFLDVVPAEGNTADLRILAAFGIVETSGPLDLLVEFIEDMTDGLPRTNVTGGVP